MDHDTWKTYSSRPIALLPTRVRRTYRGGRNIGLLHGEDDSTDSDRPEEWIASVTEANNSGIEYIENEGLSSALMEDGAAASLKELIESDPVSFLGEKHFGRFGSKTAFLAKLIDSAERLSIQVHPDKEFARRYLDSDYGKTEAWYILGTDPREKEESTLLMGFRDGMTKAKWRDLFEKQDIPAMTESLNKVYPKPGDVFLIEGGLPHAIGPGCLLLEIQEPTDYTFRVERTTGSGSKIPDQLVHQGLGFDKLMDCFHYGEENAGSRIPTKVLREESGGQIRELIGPDSTDCFSMNEITVCKTMRFGNDDSFSSLFVASGHGTLMWKDGCIGLEPGGQFFLPTGLEEYLVMTNSGDPLTIIQCLPPSYR